MKYFISFVYLIVLLFSIQACSSSEEHANQNKTKQTKDTTLNKDTVQLQIDSTLDDAEFVMTAQQKDSLLQHIHLLQNSSYHHDEVDPSIAQKRWYCIIDNGDQTFIQKVNVTIVPEHDPVVDPNDEMTGWKVSIDQEGQNLFLISGISLEEKEIKSFDFEQKWLQPGDTLSFDYLDQHYNIIAEGDRTKGAHELYKITNFKLFLKKDSHSQKLISIPQNNDATPKVLWVGDLDQDGQLDFIINTTKHYNAYIPTLYLSSFAEKGKLVKEVTKRASVGC